MSDTIERLKQGLLEAHPEELITCLAALIDCAIEEQATWELAAFLGTHAIFLSKEEKDKILNDISCADSAGLLHCTAAIIGKLEKDELYERVLSDERQIKQFEFEREARNAARRCNCKAHYRQTNVNLSWHCPRHGRLTTEDYEAKNR